MLVGVKYMLLLSMSKKVKKQPCMQGQMCQQRPVLASSVVNVKKGQKSSLACKVRCANSGGTTLNATSYR